MSPSKIRAIALQLKKQLKQSNSSATTASLAISAWDPIQTTVISHKGRRYRYFGISPHQLIYLKTLIKHHRYGRAWQYLRRFSRPDLYPKHRSKT